MADDGFVRVQQLIITENEDTKFIAPKPKPISPTGTDDVLSPPLKDNRPAAPLKEQGKSKRIQELLSEAKQLSAKQAKVVIEITKTKQRNTLIDGLKPKKIMFCEAHIIEDDKEFLAITRTIEPSTKAAYRLLMANGGQIYLGRGFTIAQAWDLLRKERQNNLLRPPGKQFDRRPKHRGQYKAYVQGVPTEDDLWRKAWQSKTKDEDNELEKH